MDHDREKPQEDQVGETPEEPPPYDPDPELITFLERGAKPGEVKVWQPKNDK